MKRSLYLLIIATFVTFGAADVLFAGHCHSGHSGHHHVGHHHHHVGHSRHHHYHHSYYPSYRSRSYSHRYPSCTVIYIPQPAVIMPEQRRKVEPIPLPVPGLQVPSGEVRDNLNMKSPPPRTVKFVALKKTQAAQTSDQQNSQPLPTPATLSRPLSTVQLGPRLATPRAPSLMEDDEVPWVAE